MLIQRFSASVVSFVLAATSTVVAAVPTAYTYDFIPNSSRTGFNGFEQAPVNVLYGSFAGSYPYTEGGISVEQVDGEPPSGIWMTCGAIHAAGYCFGATGHDGNYSWYPNGGDSGYTKITRPDGSDFDNVGFLTGNAYTSVGATYLRFELRDAGNTVLTGQVLIPQGSPDTGYMGFGGGGFDEVRVSEVSVTGGLNALALDSVEMSALQVPEPSSFMMLAAGLFGIRGARRSRSSALPNRTASLA